MADKNTTDNAVTSWTASNVAAKVSRSDAQLLAQSVLLEETNPPTVFRTTVFTILGLIVLFLIWASFTKFAEKAAATGQILPSNSIQRIQHVDGGRVKEILVSEGALVGVGDILIKLDDTDLVSQMDRLTVRYDTLSIELEAQRAFLDKRQPNLSRFQARYAGLVRDQLAAFSTAEANRRARLRVVTAQLAARTAEVSSLRAEVASVTEQVAALKETLDIRERLAEQGSGSRINFLEAKRQHAEAGTDLTEKQTAVTRAETSLAEVNARKLELENEFSKDAAERVATINAEMLDARSQLAALDERLAQTVVQAQTDGQISGVADIKVGNVIPAGQTIMTIVPSDDTLVAEVLLSPKDIGHVAVGMPVLVRVDTYKYGRMGGINGTVERISADTIQNEQGTSFFRTWVTLEKNYVGVDPQANRIIPGMTVTADIRTGEKSLIAYLLRPIHSSLQSAFSER